MTGNNDPSVGLLKTGTYTGDDSISLAVTGVGFQPKYLKIWVRETSTGVTTPIFETTDTIIDDNASGMCIVHLTTATHHGTKTNCIIALDADGFTVDDNGANEHPNKLNQVYNYMAIGG